MLLELLPFFIILKNSPRARLSFGDELLLQKNKIFISKKTRKTIFHAKNWWQFYLKKKPHKIGKNWMIKNYYWLKKDSTEDFSIFSVIFVRVCERVCVCCLPNWDPLTFLEGVNISPQAYFSVPFHAVSCPLSGYLSDQIIKKSRVEAKLIIPTLRLASKSQRCYFLHTTRRRCRWKWAFASMLLRYLCK